MALLIRTTGIEDYAPGGTARVKVLVIGGPGAGKTRWSSYFPKPIFADCEKGRASIADRSMPYAEINTSEDMLDLLAMMKRECRQPKDGRKYETIVIDTLDAYQRKVKNEWQELNNTDTFTGWEAWGYLNAKMQLLMTRLLNLDMNVIVNVHYKDKTVKDNESGRESKELMLQLQGESADTAFNDFDLVGWMGTFWKAEGGERVQKRGLTFKPKPDRPFLKDRLHVTPDWLEVNFDGEDYTRLFAPIQAKAETLGASQIVEEVPSAEPERSGATVVVAPGALGSGPVGTRSLAAELPLNQMDKPTLVKMARDQGITAGPNGPLAGNSTKAEYIEALEAHRAGKTPTPSATPDTGTPKATGQPATTSTAAPAKTAPRTTKAAANPRRTKAKIQSTEAGLVDVSTGEIKDEPQPTASEQIDAEHDAAVELVKDTLGAKPVEDPEEDNQPYEPEEGEALVREKAKPEPAKPAESTQAASPAPFAATCQICGKSLAGERPDIVKIGYIRFRKRVCEADYDKLKAAR